MWAKDSTSCFKELSAFTLKLHFRYPHIYGLIVHMLDTSYTNGLSYPIKMTPLVVGLSLLRWVHTLGLIQTISFVWLSLINTDSFLNRPNFRCVSSTMKLSRQWLWGMSLIQMISLAYSTSSRLKIDLRLCQKHKTLARWNSSSSNTITRTTWKTWLSLTKTP